MLLLIFMYKFLYEHVFNSPVKLLGYKAMLVCYILRNCDTFSQWLHHFTSLPAMCGDSSFSRSSPTLVTIYLFYFSHPHGYEVYLIMALICSSLMADDAEYLLMCLLGTCMSSLKKCLFKYFASS